MKSGFIAVVGRANAGKSTLVNCLVGEKVAIVSPKPQTTRENILGILTDEDCQIVFIDTPGIHAPKTGLGDYMRKSAETAGRDVSGVIVAIDAAKGVSPRDEELMEKYRAAGVPVLPVLTKIDLVRAEQLLPELAKLNRLSYLAAVVPVSAKKKKNIGDLLSEIKKLLSDDVRYFPEDMVTDKSETYMVREIVRESILFRYNEEIPHGIGVSVNKFDYDETKKCYDIDMDVVCEKQGHKAILIGKGGTALKDVAVSARKHLEDYLGGKVFLTLWVRVKEDWRNREALLREFGYDKKELE